MALFIAFFTAIFLDELCALVVFFFFQAEDGIRDVAVTGVQTCALPIFFTRVVNASETEYTPGAVKALVLEGEIARLAPGSRALRYFVGFGAGRSKAQTGSEERRVGEEGRSRWAPYH